MADERSATARFEITDLLPDGELVVPIERDGLIIWAVRRGHMTPELADAANRLLEHITGNGLWRQHWGGGEQPPQQYRQAS